MDHPSQVLTLREAARRFLHHLFSFSGRASRSEYFMGSLILQAFFTLAMLIFLAEFLLIAPPSFLKWENPILLPDISVNFITIAMVICFITAFIAGLGLLARRYHDTGRSAWWLLLFLLIIVPLVNFIVMIVQFAWVIRISAPDNKYGPQPPETLGAPQLTFKESFHQCFRRPLRFTGRLSRQEYWLQNVSLWIAWCFFYLAAYIPFLIAAILKSPDWIMVSLVVVILVSLLITMICSLSQSARRLHDMGRSGWWVLLPILIFVLSCIPFIGGIVGGLFFIGWSAWLCGLSVSAVEMPSPPSNEGIPGATDALSAPPQETLNS